MVFSRCGGIHNITHLYLIWSSRKIILFNLFSNAGCQLHSCTTFYAAIFHPNFQVNLEWCCCVIVCMFPLECKMHLLDYSKDVCYCTYCFCCCCWHDDDDGLHVKRQTSKVFSKFSTITKLNWINVKCHVTKAYFNQFTLLCDCQVPCKNVFAISVDVLCRRHMSKSILTHVNAWTYFRNTACPPNCVEILGIRHLMTNTFEQKTTPMSSIFLLCPNLLEWSIIYFFNFTKLQEKHRRVPSE